MKKKSIFLLMYLCMAFALLPMTAFAGDDIGEFGPFLVSVDVDVDVDTIASYAGDTLTIRGDCTIGMVEEGATTTTDRIVVDEAANIILDGVDIQSTSGAAFRITSAAGAVNITLADNSTNILISGYNRAGLQKENTAQLTITCEREGGAHSCNGSCGTLFATGGNSSAGIGGGYTASASGITIAGGTVNATGNYGGAGIGGGYNGGASDITIAGGIIEATGGDYAAGIGGGRGHGASGITITGGTVNATGHESGAGIGGGEKGDASDITITGGIIEATGGDNGAGIGGGVNGSGSIITISGGTVIANAGSGASGIGIGCSLDGLRRSASNITIAGGTVTVNKSWGGVGIVGGGPGATGIKITGGNVLADFGTGDAAPKNNDAEPVYKATFTVPDIDTDFTEVDLTIAGYNTSDIKTLNTDKVYVYLPAGEATVTYDGVDYTTTVTADGEAIFTAPTEPQEPTFNTDLSTTEQVVAANASVTLTVEASVSDGGTITYQWYSNDTNSTEGAELITGVTNDTYTFNASATPNDITYYFCVATNSNNSQKASATSAVQPIHTKNNVATIDAFSFTSPAAVGTVDSSANTVAISVPAGTDVTELTPTIELTDSKASVSPGSGTAQDFSNPVTYTVTAEDGTTTKAYIVTVTILPADTYTISANPTTKNFGSVTIGYSTVPAAETITITNTGNQSVTLIQPTAIDYDVTALSSTNLATNGVTATFSIQPKVGLAAGSHTETITINTTSDTGATVSVSFTVNKRSSGGGGAGSGNAYYRLSFDTNGGSDIDSLQCTKNSSVDLSRYTPTREGYNFIGWYLDEALTQPASSIKMVENTSVYAKWLPVGPLSNFSLSGKYKGYLDVDESKWYGTAQESAICDVTLLGIMEGDGNGYFRPEDGIKLSEAIKMAAVVHSIYSGDGHIFDAANDTNWYDVYKDYAIEHDIIEPGDFEDITAYATRAEMAYIFARSLPESEIERISSLVPPDVAGDDKYAEEIYLLYAAGILIGNDKYGTFTGERGITRAEAAMIITRIAIPDKRIAE